ncbi:MAG: histidine kinase [Sphingobacteriales bacterium]|nr:histidine kinase [Sphingobacteriales bacterium]MBI3720521.1 histidine kinase [Sphingobacteriales bacterium]
MSLKWYNKKWVAVVLHIAAWTLLFSLPFILRPNYGDNSHRPKEETVGIISYLINDLIYVSFFYFNALFLIPSFIYKRKYNQYSLIIVVCFGTILLFTWFLFFSVLGQSKFNIRGHLLFNFFFFLFILAGSTAYRMIKDRTRADRVAREKENENLKTELSLLRSQASPHFMFNVLNNMVALARKKSDLLEPALLKFSLLMRYMLYETDEDKVPLEKEIEYLQSYIDLQQLRFGKNVAIEVNMQNNDVNYEIEPMLLIPFVENAFKHGTGMIEEAHIGIDLKTENGILIFVVKNKYNHASIEIKDKTSGIGLNNVKRRLNLLYGDKQKLQITKKDNWFTVSLNLNLH